ncbi:SurA N-terminal domain-containing protein [Cryptosporangium aurantiacum]|uniref:SurA N-terminal domain-containing protein n=1 Tax=Cryptosporangium aurantiacum TaxID=134849 RepID=A0A1M7RJ34_9ACTN|nr:SurA N-terminal domain-containing protein [Cryptosporangium aurantiacum]
MFRRLLAAVAVSVLLIGLSSCRSDPTVAAYVGDDEITISQIDSYYTKAVSDPVSAAQAQQDPGGAKSQLVSMLVFIELLREAADTAGIPVTAGQIAQAKAQIEPQRSMVTGELALLPLDDLAEFQVYQVLMGQWASAGSTDRTAAGQKYVDALRASEKDNPVTVNPRYGAFDLEEVPTMADSDVAVKPVPTPASQS